MNPKGSMGFRRYPDSVQRQLDVAAASAWEALVEMHTGHALRFVALMSARLDFDEAVYRYLDELEVRDPMASAVRSRVLIALEHALTEAEDRPSMHAYGDMEPETAAEPGAGADPEEHRGLRRFRPDRLMKGIKQKVQEGEAFDEWIRLAVARAEEGIIKAHVDNAVLFSALLRDHAAMNDAVDDYLEALRVSGGRAQSVHQRAMARLADLHLPSRKNIEPADEGAPPG